MFGIGQINANGLVSLSAGLTVSAGNISLTDDTGTAWSINNNGAAILESVTVGGDAVNDFTGTGLAMSGNSLTASLGTAVDASEITDNTITLADVAASLTFDSDLTFVSDSATNDYHLILDNSSAGDVASFLVVTTSGEGGTVGTAVDLSDADIATALALGSNDVTVGGATISSSELALLDSGVALSELADSGTLTAGTVDINGGNIDGTAVGATAASSGAFTTLSSTGVTTLGNGSATVAIDSSDWDIDATGAMTGIANITSDDNEPAFPINLTVSGTGSSTHTLALQVDGNAGITIAATETGGAGAVGARTVQVGVSADADIVTLGDANADVSLTDAQWSIASNGGGALVSMTLSGAAGLDSSGATTLAIGNTNASAISLCNSATCDSIMIGDNADADTITIGDASNDTTTLNGSTVAIDSGDWDITTTGAMTGIGAITMDGNFSQTGATTFSTGTGTVSLNGATTVANGNTFTANGQVALGDNGDTVAVNSSDWDIDATGAMTGIASIVGNDNQTDLFLNQNVTGTDSGVHNVAFQIDGTPALVLSATGDGAGGVGAKTVNVAVTPGADTVNIGDSDTNVAITDANWTISGAGAAGFDGDITLSSGGGSLITTGGGLTLGDNSQTVFVNSSDWDISTTGAMTGIASFAGDDNQNNLFTNLNVTGADALVHTIALQIDGNTGISVAATGDAAGGVGARTVQVGVSAGADVITVGDSDADVSIIDANWNIQSVGNAQFQRVRVADATAAGGIDMGGAATLNIANTNASAVSLCNSAACDTIQIGTNADADTIQIGDNSDTFSMDTSNFDVSSGDLTLGGGDLIGLTSTSIDLGEQISGAISFFSGSSNIIFNGDADTSVLFNSTTDATESDITTTVGQDLRVSPGGVGDIVLVTDADTQVTLPGSADGVNNLVLTTGNLLVSDGDLTLSGGDFDVTMDAGDSVSVTNTGATTSSGAFVINQTTAAANLGNSAGLGVNATFVDYADDGGSDNRQGIVVSVTNNASDLGIDDNIFGVRVQNLGGVNQADGGEYAIATGSGWDVDWLLGNGETISNQTDNTIAFSGNAGNKATLTFDLNGASATNVPAMSGGASDLVTVNDSLSVGIDGDTTENIGVSGFAITGGDDLYVNDDVGINGDVYIDGLFSVGNEVSLTANSTTPSVAGGTQFLINNSAGTVITNFTNGQQGQMVFIRVVDNNTSLDCTASSIQCGSTDITLGTGDGLLLYKQDPGTWQLVSLMDNSDNHNAGNGFDYAEWFPSREALVPGEVVSVDSTGIEYVKASTGAYDRTVVGVVSTQPGMTIGEPTSAHAAQIALAGRVPVNVTDENGPIVPGDYLTASSTPGYAMKATEAGPVIAIAMDAFDGDSGQVGSKIANFWYTPPTSVASGLQGSDGSALAAGALGADTLVVSGDAVFQGSVTVEDHVNVGQDVAGRARIISGDTRVHVAFENPYVSEPIVTATLRTATDIPGYWWVEEESTTGFDLVLDGTLAYDVEFNWIALGVNDGVVSVSDGSTREINVYVVDGSVPPPAANVGSSDAVGGSDDAGIAPESPTEDVPADEPSDTLSEPDVTEEPTPVDAPVEAPVDEPVVDAPVADEPAPTVEEPVVTEPVADPSV